MSEPWHMKQWATVIAGVTRLGVPGGWIYRYQEDSKYLTGDLAPICAMVFVPDPTAPHLSDPVG